jgi:serine/threonine protein kinase
MFGLLKLPNPTVLPPECSKFALECELERAGNFSKAIELYESRMPSCGTMGWQRAGKLGSGRRVSVQSVATPCGKQLALKSTHYANLVSEHIGVDCLILQRLARMRNHLKCAGCIPQYYHYSNITGSCYSERINGVTANVLFDRVERNTSVGVALIVDLYRQALNILEVLDSEGVRHRDLSIWNVLIRLPEHKHGRYSMVLIDFGGAYADGIPGVVNGAKAGAFYNAGKTDTYTLACATYIYMYGRDNTCKMGVPKASAPDDSFESFLLAVMQGSRGLALKRTEAIDFSSLHSKLTSVKRF